MFFTKDGNLFLSTAMEYSFIFSQVSLDHSELLAGSVNAQALCARNHSSKQLLFQGGKQDCIGNNFL